MTLIFKEVCVCVLGNQLTFDLTSQVTKPSALGEVTSSVMTQEVITSQSDLDHHSKLTGSYSTSMSISRYLNSIVR